MKVLIQNPQNLLYLEALGRWSPEADEAFDFGDTDHAIQFCAVHSIAPVQVVLQWSGMPYSITMPIASARSRKHT